MQMIESADEESRTDVNKGIDTCNELGWHTTKQRLFSTFMGFCLLHENQCVMVKNLTIFVCDLVDTLSIPASTGISSLQVF